MPYKRIVRTMESLRMPTSSLFRTSISILLKIQLETTNYASKEISYRRSELLLETHSEQWRARSTLREKLMPSRYSVTISWSLTTSRLSSSRSTPILALKSAARFWPGSYLICLTQFFAWHLIHYSRCRQIGARLAARMSSTTLRWISYLSRTMIAAADGKMFKLIKKNER